MQILQKLLLSCINILAICTIAYSQESVTVFFAPNTLIKTFITNTIIETKIREYVTLLCVGNTNHGLVALDTNNWLACSYNSIPGLSFAITHKQMDNSINDKITEKNKKDEMDNRISNPIFFATWSIYYNKIGVKIWTNQLFWWSTGLMPDWASATNLP